MAIITVAALLAGPALAEDKNGKSLMQEGMELFFEGLRDEMSPALEDLRALRDEFGPSLRGFLTEMGPAFADMLEEVRDWSRYHPPEILPNGDIIIRRKQDDPPAPEQPQGPTDI